MFSLNCVISCFVLFVGPILGLVELPQVDDNNILTTEAAIRGTINTLFYKLGLRGIKTKPGLKKYSTVHNHLVSFTLQDYTNLKEIAKLTRVDKTNINNETESFMTVINELLNEDVVEENTEATINEANDESVIEYIEQFLTKLERLKKENGVTHEKFHLKDDIYKLLKDDNVLSYNFTMDNIYKSDYVDNDTLIDDNNFWKPDVSGRRIYRGDRTKIKYFPFMASIQIFNKFHCGGSIIKSDLVITASSCLQLAWNNRFFRENPAFLSVRVGSNFYNGGGENIPVMSVYFHPQYNPKNLWNNICLLRLIRHLRFKKRAKKIKKIDFDRTPSNLPYTTDGITIVGWGARGLSSVVKNPWENILAVAILDVYPLRECQDIYSREYVTHRHFCAGFFSKGGGACNHDVGGPGVANGILMGIVSFGSPVCGTPDAPTVFTKVGYYTDWIEEIMEQNVPRMRKRTTIKQKTKFTIGQFFRPVEQTTFKIPPLGGKLKPVPINQVDALRLLQNGKLFQQFLSTMFGDNEGVDYQDLLQDLKPQQDEIVENKEESIIRKPFEMPAQVSKDALSNDVPSEEPPEVVTEIAIVETGLTTADPTSVENSMKAVGESVTNVDENEKLDKELVNLIDDIDLKEIIDNMPDSVEEDKLLDENKLENILKERDMENKISKMDESVMTLLYLSDTEKVANGQNNTELSMQEYEYYEDRHQNQDDSGGLSIPMDTFRDLTYRNSIKSEALNDEEQNNNMYYLITEANTDTADKNDQKK